MEQPQLAEPGAGLPFFESLFVRWYVGPFQSRKADKDQNLRLFRMVCIRIVKEVEAVPENKRDQRVLVPRMRGIEDSSRFWSVNETLEHLVITGEAMRGIIELLAQGKTSDYRVDIANFKPMGKYTGGEGRQAFIIFSALTSEALGPLKIEDAGPTHLHPWLGPFNALQWTWLLAGHGGLHLAQLQAIKKGL